MTIKQVRPNWKGTMTGRERFNNQMHYKPIDRSFNREFGYWRETLKTWPIFVENNITQVWEYRFFGLDYIEMEHGHSWMSPPFTEAVIEERGSTKIIINQDGNLAEVPKDAHGTIPHFLKSSIVTPEDWKRVKEERFRLDDPARIINIEQLKKRHPADREYPLGVSCGSMIGKIRDMLTFEGLAYACFDYPDMVEDMVETCCRLVEYYLDQVLPHMDFDYAGGWEDICFKNGPIVTVDFFKNVVMPRYKRISKKLRQYGIDIYYVDCDGDVRPILPFMMEGGINCLFPFEVNCCTHPKSLLDEYGKDLRIMGGIDKLQFSMGKEAIKAYLESLVPLVERGGFIPHLDHLCPPDIKQEDYLYYLDLKEHMFGLREYTFL